MTHHGRLLLAIVTLIVLPFAASASQDDSRFQEANSAYSRNDFATAIATYEALTEEHGYSASLLYNLANSYAQEGRTGKAVLNYERALTLAPHHPDLLGNLQLVRTASGLFNREATLVERVLQFFSMNQWLSLGALGLATLTGTLLLSFRVTITPRTLVTVAICCTTALLAATIATLHLRSEWNYSVVISESHLQISPFDGAASAGNIPEGRKVYHGKRHGSYVFIEDESGRKGWILQSAIEPILPARS